MNQSRLTYLFQLYTRQEASTGEVTELMELLGDPANAAVVQALLDNYISAVPESTRITSDNATAMLEAIFRAAPLTASVSHRVHFLRRWGWAAAVLLLITGATTWLFTRSLPPPTTAQITASLSLNILPGSNKAILTLADGSSVTLDSAGKQVIQQGHTAIHQSGGQLQYENNDAATGVTYNTLSTPRGGQFSIKLPDGTQVWLNAASSLRYPVAFTGSERKVEISGEGYFEVAPDATKPFRVSINNSATIEVLGTRFNVNAYTNEKSLNTTLLDGAVRINAAGNKVTLLPGQQAQLTNEHITVTDNTDLNKVMAWKNGLFDFDDMSLQEAMQQLERWYDIKVSYENGIPDIPFGGKISRNLPLGSLLKLLAGADLKCRMEEGRRLVITK